MGTDEWWHTIFIIHVRHICGSATDVEMTRAYTGQNIAVSLGLGDVKNQSSTRACKASYFELSTLENSHEAIIHLL